MDKRFTSAGRFISAECGQCGDQDGGCQACTKRVYIDGAFVRMPIDACELRGVMVSECDEPDCTHLTDEMQPVWDPDADTIDAPMRGAA